MAEILLKSGLGAIAIATVMLLVRSGNAAISGIAVMFPTVTIVGVLAMRSGHHQHGAEAAFVRSAIIALPVYLVFLGSLYLFISRLPLAVAIALSCMVWLSAAGIFVMARGGIRTGATDPDPAHHKLATPADGSPSGASAEQATRDH